MSSAHGPAILSGSANKKPHGTFGKLLHALEKRYFVLRLGAGSVPELAYYEGDAAVDKHQKGVLYLDHSGISITVHKDHKELQICNASKGSHKGFHHVVQDLMMEFSSLAELEKWNVALTNCLHPQPQVKHDAAAQPQIKQAAAASANASAPSASPAPPSDPAGGPAIDTAPAAAASAQDLLNSSALQTEAVFHAFETMEAVEYAAISEARKVKINIVYYSTYAP
jgi:hypothetical protein